MKRRPHHLLVREIRQRVSALGHIAFAQAPHPHRILRCADQVFAAGRQLAMRQILEIQEMLEPRKLSPRRTEPAADAPNRCLRC